MSFLFEESDAQTFVPDILDLLDFDGDSWPVALVLKDEPPPHDREPKVSTTKPRARKRPATPRLRNKAKIELLRREIASLEAELEAPAAIEANAGDPASKSHEPTCRLVVCVEGHRLETEQGAGAGPTPQPGAQEDDLRAAHAHHVALQRVERVDEAAPTSLDLECCQNGRAIVSGDDLT
ncbi:hypothetical protein PR001_g21736 [Phytophthora rubi]|uniref:Uncharacterized protein n=1 Tax=Phytophthora rubi TaxID=129364 RepID=A0A6A3JBP4_9STRA|nr:hypothetical protein PR001_g21736 [Phytophthora rubi]